MGWALANVWYDKYDGPPPQKTPLESLFMLVALRRMEADLLATRALVHASVTQESLKPTVKAYMDYADMQLPFLAAAGDMEKTKEREALLKFVKVRARIDKRTIYKKQQAQLASRGVGAGSKFKLKSRTPGL